MSETTSDQNEIERLDKAVDEFAGEMKKRLHQKAHEGYRGWDGAYSSHALIREVDAAATVLLTGSFAETYSPPKKTCVDTANRLMFLFHRGR